MARVAFPSQDLTRGFHDSLQLDFLSARNAECPPASTSESTFRSLRQRRLGQWRLVELHASGHHLEPGARPLAPMRMVMPSSGWIG